MVVALPTITNNDYNAEAAQSVDLNLENIKVNVSATQTNSATK